MTVLWSLLTSKLAGPAMAALSVALGLFLVGALVTNAGLKGQLADVHRKLDKANTSLATCKANEQTLNTAIASYNAAVDRMMSEAEARRVAGERAIREARAGSVEANRRADRVARQVPRDACGDDLIMGSVK